MSGVKNDKIDDIAIVWLLGLIGISVAIGLGFYLLAIIELIIVYIITKEILNN